MRGAIAIVGAAILALAFVSAAQAQESRTFRDWMVVCDNTRVCAAFGFSNAPGEAYLKIERQPGPGGALEAGVAVNNFDTTLPRTGWTVRADGRVLFSNLALNDQDWTYSFVFQGAEARRLVDAARDAASLTLESSGGYKADIVLSGSSASFRFIDEQQGRVGLTDALGAKGPGSPGQAPAERAQPVIRIPAAPAQNRLPAKSPDFIAKLIHHEDCDGLDGDKNFPIIKARLGPGVILWGGMCSRGAYNVSYKFYLSDDAGRNERELSFPYAPGSEQPDTTYVVNADFDAKTLILTAFEKGRGIGDCGAIVQWAWTGKAFVLLQQEVMTDCRGVSTENWPTLYRATPDQASAR